LGFGKNSPSGESPLLLPVDDPAMSTSASNVTNLVMGLTPPSGISQSEIPDADQSSSWGRGRRPKAAAALVPALPEMWSDGALAPQPYYTTSPGAKSPRALSPASARSGEPVASSASSMISSNWRSSTSASSSASTSYSNNSSPSVSTAATSVSASSWRTQASNQSNPNNQRSLVTKYGNPPQQPIPKNIKIMSGVPWELGQLPRPMHPNPFGDIFGSPTARKPRMRKPEDQLDTIVERSVKSPRAAVPISESPEATESQLDLEQEEAVDEDGDGALKKVQKGQINALTKMLSALRR